MLLAQCEMSNYLPFLCIGQHVQLFRQESSPKINFVEPENKRISHFNQKI